MKNITFFISLIIFSHFSNAAVVVLNGLTHIHSLQVGNKFTGKVQIRNDGKKETRVKIYKQDLVAECGKEVNYTDPKGTKSSLNSWLTTTVDEKNLQPGEEFVLYYTIDLPNDITMKGSFWSVLMIEGADPIKEEQSDGLQINSVMRYAIQIIGDVGNEESPKLEFEDIRLITNPESVQVVKLRIKNEGLFNAKAKVILEIYNSDGEKIKVVEATSKRIYPQNCNDFEIELRGINKGRYDGILIADNSKDLFGANISLEIN